MVLIHGYTDNARDWAPMLPYLSKQFRLILVDIRGHGQSSKPECCYTRLDFAYDIKLLLDALGVQKADIVGHSLGSIIAQTFAEYWPERTAPRGIDLLHRRPAARRTPKAAAIRFCRRDPQAQGADRAGLAVHGRLVEFANAGGS